MILQPVTDDLAAYLAADEVIDHRHPPVQQLAAELATPEAAFLHVRDQVLHSADAGFWSGAFRASEVLAARNGICHAKSHLLAALLRAQGVPTGLCYQRLEDGEGGFVLHGLIAAHLDGRWSRLDARGNCEGVDARYDLEQERLAWPVRPELGECDYPGVYAAPPAELAEALATAVPGESGYGYLPSELPGQETSPLA
ncbi:transglutaminase-like domain-containing protein [Streptacidiphilus jiangxiensis]|uniref:Transglutaminase-like superfamily protein n=1 Tax=Streptacidiphilus jiangxiensis TaxID=235985 RepID=A0A1H7UQZ9_STRJI|nr:transglutaminase family protein [Streptacidiphilus jiangxiensis]SEL98837.1 Transglutaminase-like superfamily protein [Streptacidiphilus jiangxiensis]